MLAVHAHKDIQALYRACNSVYRGTWKPSGQGHWVAKFTILGRTLVSHRYTALISFCTKTIIIINKNKSDYWFTDTIVTLQLFQAAAHHQAVRVTLLAVLITYPLPHQAPLSSSPLPSHILQLPHHHQPQPQYP